MRYPWILSLIIAAIAFVVSASFINHGLVGSTLPAGPGLTLDESFNIDQGVYLADAISQHGPLIVSPRVTRDVFGSERYLPDHPPVGRLFPGLSHYLMGWLIPGSETCAYNVVAARLGSCSAFSLMVLLLVEFSRRRFDLTHATLVGAVLLCMPHLLGHARIASLESATNLAWVSALISLMAWWTGCKTPTLRQSMMTGVLFGLLLLTKVQGIFFGPVVAGWALIRFRDRAILPLSIVGLTGFAVFFAGWPWLWLDPVSHVMKYLGRTTDRPTLYCWYFGERFADKAVPWHFPFVMTLASLPAVSVVGLLGRVGARGFDAVDGLSMFSILLPLCIFAVPGVPVYDGTRLFLIVMPAIALMAARGLARVLKMLVENRWQLSRSSTLKAAVIASVLMMVSAFPKTSSPIAINEYGILCGGNRSAAFLGFEASYWGESLNGDFWEQVPEGSMVFMAPVSHQFQLSDLESLVPIIQQRRLRLIPFDYTENQPRGLILLLHRLADLRRAMQSVPPGAQVLIQSTINGTICNRLIDTNGGTWSSLEQ